LEAYLALGSEVINNFTAHFESDRQVFFNRNDPRVPSKIEARPGGLPDSLKFARFVAEARRCFEALDAEGTMAALLDETTRRHYEVREAELSRLETLAANLISDTEAYRRQKDQEYEKRTAALDEAFGKKRDALDAEYGKRVEELEGKEAELKKRVQAIDDRGTRHARRQIRQDFKKVLQTRSERFELTTGTRRLRRPVQVFAIILLLGFGAATVLTGIESYQLVFDVFGSESQSRVHFPLLIATAVRQLAFAGAFGATAVFFFRWHNQWFQQHAKEEFRLKRLDLDIDRASWLVEMLMEWKDEKGAGPPDQLIQRLAHNLFEDPDVADEALHPADQVARALFGSSAHILIDALDGVDGITNGASCGHTALLGA